MKVLERTESVSVEVNQNGNSTPRSDDLSFLFEVPDIQDKEVPDIDEWKEFEIAHFSGSDFEDEIGTGCSESGDGEEKKEGDSLFVSKRTTVKKLIALFKRFF